MIEINLLPEELRKKESIRVNMPEIPVKKTLFWSLGGLLAIQILLTLAAFFVFIKENSYTAEAARLREVNKEIALQKKETSEIFDRFKEIKSVTGRKFSWTLLVNSVSHSMTKGVWLRNLYMTDEDPKSSAMETKPTTDNSKAPINHYLVLEGSAVGQGQETAFIGKYLKQLKDTAYLSDLFSDIKPYNINQRRLKDFDVYDFMIYCKFKKDKI
jgi:hypothetical protein